MHYNVNWALLKCLYHYHILFPAPEDYQAIVSSTITFSPTQTSATVSVTIVDNDALEDVKQFTVEVLATGRQERVDVGDVANVYISNDDCELSKFNCASPCLTCVPASLPLHLCV